MTDPSGARSLREIVRILFQHWFMLLFVMGLGTGGTYAVCRRVVPTYRSEVSLMFKRPLDKSPISTDTGERALEVFVKAQQQIVMSDLVLARAKVISQDASLRQDWFKLAKRWASARAEGDGNMDRVRDSIRRFLRADVEDKVRRLLDEQQEVFEEFRDSVKLETPGGEQVAMTETFTLIVERPGPRGEADSHLNAKHAADILADMYVVRYQALQQALNDPALRVMEEIVDAYEKDLRKNKGAIQAYEAFVEAHSADVGVLEQLLRGATEHGAQALLTEVRQTDARLALGLARDRAVYEVMQAALPDTVFQPGGVDKMSDEEAATALGNISPRFLQEDVGFAERVKQLARLEAKLAEAETQYTDESRDVRYLREETHLAKRELLRSVVAHARGLGASIEARHRQKEMHGELVRQTAREQNAIHKKLAEYAELKHGFLAAQKHVERLEEQRIDALSSRLRARQAVTITRLGEASVPDAARPVMPKTVIYTVLAFLVSALLGTASAFTADHFDHTLRSASDAERYLGVPVLGSVKKRGRALVVDL